MWTGEKTDGMDMLCVTSDGACGGSMSHIYADQAEAVHHSMTGGDAAAMRAWYGRACLHGIPAEHGCRAWLQSMAGLAGWGMGRTGMTCHGPAGVTGAAVS